MPPAPDAPSDPLGPAAREAEAIRADRADAPVWALERRIGRQLLAWSALSVALGAALALPPLGAFALGVGLQFALWGVIDAAIVLVGRRQLARKLARSADPARERRSLRRLLLVNAGLDLLYVTAGVAVIVWTDGPFGAGNGAGVIAQGGFLLLFDAWHGLRSVPALSGA